MAVPGSGSLSLAAIAAEKQENDYTDVDTALAPYSLREITQGGGAENYDATNQQSPSHPDNVAAYSMGEFYAYDHDFQAIPCNKAMDVVFIIDYTGSMADDFNNSATGLKANVTNITNKIVSRSGGDYRLGLVIVDAMNTSDPDDLYYSDSSTYTGLAAEYKHHQVVDTTGHIHSTAIVDFEYANATNFSSKLNLLSSINNDNGNMVLGGGQGTVGWEVALNQVLNNDFAGSFRSGVQRMIIFVTDTTPEGTSTRSFNGAEETALMGTLSSQAVANVCTISIIGTISDTASSDGTTSAHTIYNGYANNTGGLTDFSADPQGIIQFIEDICDDVEEAFPVFTDVSLHSTFIDSSPTGSVSASSPSTTRFDASFVVTDVNNNTANYWKPWATNSSGTSFGDTETVTASKWTANGNVASSSTITSRGFVYGLSPNNLSTLGTYVTATGGTNTYQKAIVNNAGLDSMGWTYCNAGFSVTPIVSYNNNVPGVATGNQFVLYTGSIYPGTKTQTVNEGSVPLLANNTYKLRGWFEQKNNGGIVYSTNIATFTVSASYDFTSTISVGSDSIYTTNAYGYGSSASYFPTMGSMSNYTFNGKTIAEVYWQDTSGTDTLFISFTTTKPSFSNLVINGTSYGASSTWTSYSTTKWGKTVTGNAMGTTSGFATLNMNV
jgi:hypothetical protein